MTPTGSWCEDERRAILRFVDDRADRALTGEADVDREQAFRDCAVVYLLGLSGVREAEVFAEPADDKRTGITWSDVQLDDGAVRILGKSREYEYPRSSSGLQRHSNATTLFSIRRATSGWFSRASIHRQSIAQFAGNWHSGTCQTTRSRRYLRTKRSTPCFANRGRPASALDERRS